MKARLNRDSNGKYLFTEENFKEFFFFLNYYTERKYTTRNINIRAEYRYSYAKRHGYKFTSNKTKKIVRAFVTKALRNSALNQNTGKLRIFYVGTIRFYRLKLEPGRWGLHKIADGKYKFMQANLYEMKDKFISRYRPRFLPSNSTPRFFINLSTKRLRKANGILYDTVEYPDIFPYLQKTKMLYYDKVYSV
jgi:hypothetical protein